jgi:uncharacterized protein (TIGR03000 family)
MSLPSLSFRIVALVLTVLFAGPTVRSQEPEARASRVFVVVNMPPEANLTVDGTATRQRGEVRRFYSPALEAGKYYHYIFVARWEPNNYTTITRTRKVVFQAGQRIELDMRNPDPRQPDNVVIRYVPTPEDIVLRMMQLGKVGKDDVVYDLGCGDGRLVITAVKQFHARRGVGVDLDEQRIRESRANAARLGVQDRVEFRQGDVLKLKDLSEASVVMLYMGDELNLAVRPLLLQQLKPGSRVVSHRFTMGDWKPDKTETVLGEYGDVYVLHLWTIPKREKER